MEKITKGKSEPSFRNLAICRRPWAASGPPGRAEALPVLARRAPRCWLVSRGLPSWAEAPPCLPAGAPAQPRRSARCPVARGPPGWAETLPVFARRAPPLPLGHRLAPGHPPGLRFFPCPSVWVPLAALLQGRSGMLGGAGNGIDGLLYLQVGHVPLAADLALAERIVEELLVQAQPASAMAADFPLYVEYLPANPRAAIEDKENPHGGVCWDPPRVGGGTFLVAENLQIRAAGCAAALARFDERPSAFGDALRPYRLGFCAIPLVAQGLQAYSARGFSQRPHFMLSEAEVLAAKAAFLAAGCAVEIAGAYVPTDSPVGFEFFQSLLELARCDAPSVDELRNNYVCSKGYSCQRMTGPIRTGGAPEITTSGMSSEMWAYIQPTLGYLDQLIRTALPQFPEERARQFGWKLWPRGVFEHVAVAISSLSAGTAGYVAAHRDTQNDWRDSADGMAALTCVVGAFRVCIFVYTRAICGAAFESQRAGGIQQRVRDLFFNAVHRILGAEYPWKPVSRLADLPSYRPRTRDRLDHISSQMAPLIFRASFWSWPRLAQLALVLFCSQLGRGDFAVQLARTMPTHHEFLVANRIPASDTMRLLLRRLSLLGTALRNKQRAPWCEPHWKRAQLLGVWEESGYARGDDPRYVFSVDRAQRSRACGGDLANAVRARMDAVVGQLREFEQLLTPDADPARVFEAAVGLPGGSDLTTGGLLVGLIVAKLWVPTPTRLTQTLEGHGFPLGKGSRESLDDFCVSKDELLALVPPELRHYYVVENQPCEVGRMFNSCSVTATQCDLTGRAIKVVFVGTPGFPTLVARRGQGGAFGLWWVPTVSGIESIDDCEAVFASWLGKDRLNRDFNVWDPRTLSQWRDG